MLLCLLVVLSIYWVICECLHGLIKKEDCECMSAKLCHCKHCKVDLLRSRGWGMLSQRWVCVRLITELPCIYVKVSDKHKSGIRLP